MIIDKPYFMKNKECYFFDFKNKKYELTESATREDKESYVKYYNQIENIEKKSL